jgi:hypothetical protein
MTNSTIPAPGGAGQQKSLLEQQQPEAVPAPAKTATTEQRIFANRAPIAANSDPLSSHVAGAEITASGQRSCQKAEILDWLRGREPLTSAEIAAAGCFDRHMVARRLPDLAADGLLERCSLRACQQSGRSAVTWRAV